MADEPKIRFDAPFPFAMVDDLPLTVSPQASDLLAAFHMGFTKCLTMWREMTKPVMVQQPSGPAFNPAAVFRDQEEGEYEPGVLDMRSILAMSPEGREAVLRQYGLQMAGASEGEKEPDPTVANVRQMIEEGEDTE